MNITPLSGSFGAVVDNVDLSRATADETLQLQTALLAFGLLVVRDQELTPQQHVDATRLFGEPETFHPGAGQIRGLPEVFRLASRSGEGYLDVGRYWHSDGSFREDPTPISMWHTIETPEGAGATLFTDLGLALHDLAPAMRREIATVRTLHRNGVVHPLVMRHPVTGQENLYLNVGLTSSVANRSADEARTLIDGLDQHMSRPVAMYQHDWRPGDVVIADNYRVAHKATAITAASHRVLDRTTVAAGTAFKQYLAQRPDLLLAGPA